jgi:uncharacterized protein YqjF (DUF2071 family)
MSGDAAKPQVFLTAEWRNLVMLNYEADPASLEPFVPKDLELDFWSGKTYVSLVGFLFHKARIFGLSIPFHRNFPEVNLRFYVTRHTREGYRRGVVFLKEIVPRWAVACVARSFFGEKFVSLPLRATIETLGAACNDLQMKYEWRFGREQYSLVVRSNATPRRATAGSLDEFIVDHYWGYAATRKENVIEYEVEHEPWLIRPTYDARFTGDAEALYGSEIAEALSRPPASAFLVDGSAVAVRGGRHFKESNRVTLTTASRAAC